MAEDKRTWVRPSVYEAKLHATAERQQSVIAGWTRLRVLVAVLRRPFSFGTTPKDEDHNKRNKNGSPKAPVSNPNQ